MRARPYRLVGGDQTIGATPTSRAQEEMRQIEGMLKSNRALILSVLLAFAVSGNPNRVAHGGQSTTSSYQILPNWPQPVCGEGYTWGATGGIWAVSPDRVYVFQRGCLPALTPSNTLLPERSAHEYSLTAKREYWPRWDHIFLVFNRDGELVQSWEQYNKLFVKPHGVVVNPYDPERNVWLTDVGTHQIYKFSADGKKLLMTLGERGVPGNDKNHFNQPTSIVWLPNGDFYVGDGYVNTRVIKFSKDGTYLMEWGKPGKGPGEFNLVHALAVDNNRRIYVADRGNSRIQIFDENGKYLSEWPNIEMPLYMLITENQQMWIAAGDPYQMLAKYDLNGRRLYSWGTPGQQPGGLWAVHQFSVDSDGNLYTADIRLGRPQKFVPRPGAAMLMGKPSIPFF